jgi:CheY-like chemotaxis protein
LQQRIESEIVMDPSTLESTTQHSISTDLLTVGFVRGHQHRMHAEEISASRILLRAKQAIRPLDPIELMWWIDDDEEPLCCLAQVQYVERTWGGFRVDAVFQQMAQRDRVRWERYVKRAEDAHPDLGSGLFLPWPGRRRPQLLTIGNILPAAVCAALREAGVMVHQAKTMARALQMLSGRPDIIVADASSSAVSGVPLCQNVSAAPEAADVLLFVEYASEQDFERYLEAGAARVILKPCNQATLLQRIRTTLVERTELQTAAYASASTLQPVAALPKLPPRPPANPRPRKSFWSGLRGKLRDLAIHALV